MRAAFLALLLINLAYFGYTRLAPDAPEGATSADASSVPRLALVGEGNPSPPRCTTVGPFANQADGQKVAAWLVASHHGSRLHSADAPGPPSYWVAIITKTLQDATKIGLRLRAAGVQDLVIMPPDPGATNAIVSLGIFSERDHADKRLTELRKYAVSPTVIEQPHTVTTWWVDVQTASGESPPDVAAFAKAGGETGSLRMSACATQPAPVDAPAAASAAPKPTDAPATPAATPSAAAPVPAPKR